jgi:hypothetical protein
MIEAMQKGPAMGALFNVDSQVDWKRLVSEYAVAQPEL